MHACGTQMHYSTFWSSVKIFGMYTYCQPIGMLLLLIILLIFGMTLLKRWKIFLLILAGFIFLNRSSKLVEYVMFKELILQ